MYGEGRFLKASWPLGKIELDSETLTIDVLSNRFQLQFSQIERFKMGRTEVRVIHHASGVPDSIIVSGWWLPRRLRQAIAAHNLPVQR
jgi:hypothetical protein